MATLGNYVLVMLFTILAHVIYIDRVIQEQKRIMEKIGFCPSDNAILRANFLFAAIVMVVCEVKISAIVYLWLIS
ncbi:MAG TPA: hypothetical protein PKW95_17100 [bacterium]|nr:hypothetical protein [bacterium]